MHLRAVAGEGQGQTSPQSTQGVVPELGRGDHRRRLCGDVRAEASATSLYHAAGVRLYADLPLPCTATADAAAPDRHRPIQIPRIQAERAHQADPQPGLLEAKPTLSRWNRIHDYHEPLDRDPRLRQR